MKKILLFSFCLVCSNLWADIKISGTLSDVTTGPSTNQGTITITCKGRGECGTIKEKINESSSGRFTNIEKNLSFTFEKFEFVKRDIENSEIIFYLNR
jgi:hypothetical protein